MCRGAGRILYSTSLSGTLPESVGEMTRLSTVDLHGTRVSGVGDISRSDSLVSLRLSNVSITSLPQDLPSSLTHLFLDQNPINASAGDLSALVARLPALHALSIGVVSIPIILDTSPSSTSLCLVTFPDGQSKCCGTRVTVPTGCTVGHECSWTLQLYDADDQPALTGLLITDLRIGYNCSCDSHGPCRSYSCEHTRTMVDNRDGTFTATVPSSGWVSTQGSHMFRFYHGDEEFQPNYDRFDSYKAYDILRTVNFRPINCTSKPHSEHDSTGSTCICKPNYTQNSDGDCYPSCENGTSVVDGSTCQCPRNTYDVRHAGVIMCTTQDWTAEDKRYGDYIATLKRDHHSVCLKCPDECASCAGGVANLSEGWRLNSTDLSQIGNLLRDAAFRPQFAFQCPSAAYEDVTCPPMLLNTTFKFTGDAHCRSHHTGPLCAMCEQGYSRRNSDGSCKQCSDESLFQEHFGLSRNLFVLLILAAVLIFGGSIYWQRQRLKRAKEQVFVMLKIALGLAQVLALLKDVLNLMFPDGPRQAMSYVGLFTADFHMLYAFDCNGWDWYSTWLLTVLGLPATAVLAVGCRYTWQRWYGRDAKALSNATAALFFVVLLLYPRVSSLILSALRCRRLGEYMQRLEVDYSVDCLGSRYQRYRTFALVMLAAWPIGIPVGLLGLLWKNWRHSVQTFEAEAAGNTDGQPRSDFNAASAAVQHSKEQFMRRYAFCLNDYRPEAWWFEPADMLRKLALSGLLQFVQRGTAAQVLVGCCISFASFGVHVRLLPYRESEANVLKVCAEAVLFLTFLISFILRVLPRVEMYEPVRAETYGYLLLSSYGVFATLFVALVARQTYRRRRFQQGIAEFAQSSFEGDSGVQELAMMTSMPQHQETETDEVSPRPANVPAAESTFTLEEPLTEVREGGEERLQPVARSPLDRLYAWVASQ
eukprot:COSAG02_NODE_133_length_34692_cov_83.845229_6_plen_931_part_00